MQISKPVRKHAPLVDRQGILQAYRHTPLSQREFATQVGISVATLNQWRRQSSAPPPTDRPQFVALPNCQGTVKTSHLGSNQNQPV